MNLENSMNGCNAESKNESKIRGFMCRSILEDMFICEINRLDREIERLKKHIELGHKGSPLEPRDYNRELDIAMHRKEKLIEVYNYLKSKCPP